MTISPMWTGLGRIAGVITIGGAIVTLTLWGVSIEYRISIMDNHLSEITSRTASESPGAEVLSAILLRDHLDELRGPRGPKGEKGESGPTGRPGADGHAPTADEVVERLKSGGLLATTATSNQDMDLLVIRQGKCLVLTPASRSITGVTFESGSLLCDANAPRYSVECARSNRASCIVSVTHISSGKRFRIRSGGTLNLTEIGDFTFYLTGFDNEAQPRTIQGGISAN